MPKFTLSAKITVSAQCVVEAATLEEAIAKSEDLEGLLWFNGCGHEDGDGWMVEDIDGSPFDIVEA